MSSSQPNTLAAPSVVITAAPGPRSGSGRGSNNDAPTSSRGDDDGRRDQDADANDRKSIFDGIGPECDCCGRLFELPRRYTVRPDDLEFLRAPRVLDCMHTCCQSCLEDSWQKSPSHEISCPVCKFTKRIDGTAFVPLDAVTIKEILPAEGVVPEFCSRCRDDISTFSWCSSCCSALCDFHHQDHKLSKLTANHNVRTLSEIRHAGVKIVHKLPPIPCPHDASRDSTVFCHVCGYLVSADGMLQHHRNHEYTEAVSLYGPSQIMMEAAHDTCNAVHEDLSSVLAQLQEDISRLNRDTNASASKIESTFSSIRKALARRESEMLLRLRKISDRKRAEMSRQVSELRAAMDECSRLAEVSARLAAVGNSPDDEFAGMYVVSTAHSVRRASASILEKSQSLPSTPYVDPCISTCFDDQEVYAIGNAIDMLGWIECTDCPPELTESGKRSENKNNDASVESQDKIGPIGEESKQADYKRDAQGDVPEADCKEAADARPSSNNMHDHKEEDEKSSYARKNMPDQPIRIPLTLYFAINTKQTPAISRYSNNMDGSESVQVDIRVTSEDTPRQQLGNSLSETFAAEKIHEFSSSIEGAAANWGGVIKNPFVDSHKQKRSPCHFEVIYDPSTGSCEVETAQEARGVAYKKRLAASLGGASVDLSASRSTADLEAEALNCGDASTDKLLGQIFLITETDKKFTGAEVRSFYEWITRGPVPSLRISRDVVKKGQ